MKKKLIRSSVIVLSVAVLLMVGLSALLITLTNRSNAEAEAKSKLAIFVESWKKYGDAEELVRIPEGADYRLTVVAAEDGEGVVRGQVLADSARPAAEMDNHWEREEIQSAAAGEDRTFLRYSETLRTDMLYFARAAESETAGKAIVRIAIPASRYNAYFVSYLSFSVAAILLVGLGLLVLWLRLSSGIYAPLVTIRRSLEDVNCGNYRRPFVSGSDEEETAIMIQIGELADKIDASLSGLREEKHKIDFIVDHLKEGIVALNAKDEVVLINAKAKQLFARYTREGNNVAFFTSNEDILSAVANASGEGKPFDARFGEKIYAVAVTAVQESDEELVSKIIVLVDVTEKRKGEELREDFFAGASHELKTPITSIRGFSELMKGETDPDKLEKYASRIYSDSTRIMNLLSDMLKLSKLDANYEDEEMRETDLAAVCEEVKADALPRLEQKSMTLTIEGGKVISCFPNKARDLISNLVDNAIKYGKPEGGHIRIKLTDKYLSVSDDGIGIEKKYLSRVFERFFMVDGSRSKKEGGTGLGLSIVKHICMVHRWTPRIDSELGKGTTITVIF